MDAEESILIRLRGLVARTPGCSKFSASTSVEDGGVVSFQWRDPETGDTATITGSGEDLQGAAEDALSWEGFK